VYGNVTTGAESDLEQVTGIARQMVGRWGMSDQVGPIAVLPRPDDERIGLPGADGVSQATRELVDAEVRRIVDECYRKALDRLRENRSKLDVLARALLERESLDEADAYAIAGFDRPPSRDGRKPADAPAGASRRGADS
jgi:cell division protease FtsH